MIKFIKTVINQGLLEKLVVAVFSAVMIFGLVKIVEAPFKEFVRYLQMENNEVDINASYLPAIEKKPVVFIFGGDVMLSRQVNSRMVKYDDYGWPFLKIADFLREADFTIINLESPFIKASDYFVPTGSFMFKADPKATQGLLAAGIDLVSLANNHSLNQGRAGLKESFSILKDNNIKYIGAGHNESEARAAEIIEINGERFAFLAYAYPNDNSVATEEQAGIATMDIAEMRADVEKLKADGNIVIVNMHAGIEYVTEPNWQQVDFAHAAIEAGAEAVIGHHPHWPQTFEFYQGKPIIYSLGNLVFDQMWSLETRQGLLAKLNWQNGWKKIELIPVKIYDYGQPEIISDEIERVNILEKVGGDSSGIIWEKGR